jgi:YidC/Oxa1 family membrane protein insertase
MLNSDPALSEIRRTFSGNQNFKMESPVEASVAMNSADVMITDYSGTAFEFALLRKRPVVFADCARKEINPNWREIGLDPIEIALRARIGIVVSPDAAECAKAALDLARDEGKWRETIEAALPAFLYRRSGVAKAAADALEDLAGLKARAAAS